MKKVILTVSAFIFSLKLMAQAPEKMSYQAVVRNSSNGLVISAPVGMRISILQGSASGASVYTETHTVNSNANGLVSLEIGSGTVVSGNFSTIDWSADTYFIQTETDPTGGTTYTVTGTSQLMSVPYALHAKSAETVINNDDADADPANEIELPTGGNNGQVLNTDGSGNYSWVDQTVNNLPNGTAVGQTAYWDGTAWVVNTNLYNNGGNIGIGTTNPTTAKLVIEGTPGAIGLDLSSTDQYANMRVLRNPDSDNAMYIGLGSGPSSQTHFYTNDLEKLTLNGGVGVNNTNPTEALDVNGNIRVSGALMPNNTAGTAGQVLTSAGAGVAPTWTTPATVNTLYSADGTLGGNRIVTQGANTLAFTGTAVNAFNVDGGTFSVDAANNRVGVLTSNPAAQFSVGGASNVSVVPGHVTQISGNNIETMALQGSTVATNLSFYKQGSTTRQAAVQSSVNALGSDMAFYTTSTTGTADQNRMIIKADGNVGIGTATPNAPLQLANTLANRKIVLFETANNDNQYLGFGVNNNVMRYQVATNLDNHIFYAGTSATTSNELMRIQGNGNVGIGTATPVERLTVAGSIQLSGFTSPTGLIVEQAGGTALNLSMNFRESNKTNTLKGGALRVDGRAGFPTFQFFTRAAGSATETTAMVINEVNNVGIGTAAPTSKLQVVGLPVYADNAAAIAGGLTAGAFYRTATGVLMVAF